jgi:two-component system alkaline phosphatase synthesis response regulator PhoP
MQQVLVVAPAAPRAARWCAALRDEGFRVASADDAVDGLRGAEAGDWSAVVLDVAMLGSDGLTLCTRLRDRGYRAQLLVVVPAHDDGAVIQSIECGADAVADDACSPRALAMQMRALMRRTRPIEVAEGHTQIGTLHIDVAARSVCRGDGRIDLSRREFDVLLTLVRERGCVVSPARLVGGVSDSHGEAVSLSAWRLARTYVHELRRKLDDGGPTCIMTVRGSGYMIPRATASKHVGTGR